MKKHQLLALLWLVTFISGQTLVDVRTQTKNVDFSGAASTIPAKSGASLPTSCKLGEMFFNISNAPGQNLYLCAPANSWTLLAGGSGSTNGTVLTASTGQFAYYGTNGSTVNGHTLVAGDIPPLSYQAPLTFTGNGSKTASSTGTLTANDCAKWDANGNVVDAGAPCGSGSGSGLTAPGTTTTGNIPQYGNTSGTALSTGLGVVTTVGTPGADTNVPTEKSVRTAISAATPAFSNLSGGTNTSSALVIGSGASLSTNGTGTIAATSVPASGVTGLAPSATTDTTNAANITSGTLSAARLPATAVTTSNATGNGTKYASSTASGVSNDCAKWDANGNIVDAGAPCGSGSGSGLTAPSTTTTGNIPQYSNTTGTALSTGLGVVTTVGSPGADTNIPTEKSVRSAISAATPAFTNVAGGTNTSSALVIGSGASLSATGTGSIAATSVPASGVSGLAPSATTDTTNAANISSGILPAARLPNPSFSSLGAVQAAGYLPHQWVYSIGTNGIPAQSQPSFGDLAAGVSTVTQGVGPGGSIVSNGGTIVATQAQILQVQNHLAYGDSITAGYLANGASGTTPTDSYVYFTSQDEKASLVNNGVTGSQACDLSYGKVAQTVSTTIDDNASIYTMMIGTNDANNKGTGAYETGVFKPCHQGAISWIAIANKFSADTTHGCTTTGTWAANSGYTYNGMASHTNGSTLTCPVTTYGEPIYFWYTSADQYPGTFTYSVDGGTPVSLSTQSTPLINTANAGTSSLGVMSIRIPASGSVASPGTHSIVFTVTSATNASNIVSIQAVGTPLPYQTYGMPRVFVGGIPKQQGNANSAVTAAYDADVQADVNLLAGDGLAVYYVPVRNYLCLQLVGGSCANAAGTLDMNTAAVDPQGLHPNTAGHNDLKQAFENAMQFTPYPSTSGSGTVNSGTASQFAYYTAAGTAVSGHTLVASDIPALNYDAAGAAATAQAASLQKSNNLSDLGSVSAARTNLGLGTAATMASTAFQSPLSFTGSGTLAVTGTSAVTTSNCAKWDGNGNIVDAGAPCGTGGGSASWSTLTPGTNTSGAFVVGSGASITASGTGLITATSVPASGVSGTLAASNLPAPTASTLGGVESFSQTSHQWINSISTAGVPVASQPSFSDISGSVAAAQLPTPTASTMGGVVSLAQTSHQWINSISTAGVPAASQPAFSDISGTATDAQLPSDQCTLTGYTVTAANISALTPITAPVYTIPGLSVAANQRICFIDIRATTAFAAANSTVSQVRIQSSGGVVFSPNQDLSTVAANNFWSDAGSFSDRANTSIQAAFTFTGATAAASAGSVNIVIGIRTMPTGF